MAPSTGAKFVRYGCVDRRACKVDRGILNDLAILNVQAIDGFERPVLGRKLGDDGELAICIDFQTRTVVIVVTESIRVVAAAPLVARTIERAFGASAFVETSVIASVRRNGSRHFVGFPDVHFVATGTFAFDIALMSS
jgi:hypothetical protein